MQTQLITKIANEEERLHIDITIDGGARIGYLQPITKSALDNAELIAKMAAWRNRMRSCFLTQTEVTAETTKTFLATCVLNDPTRLLFVVHSLAQPVGTIGLKIGAPWVHGAGPREHEQSGRKLAELANLLRGSRDGHPRLMYQGEIALMDWAFRELNIDVFWTAVPSNNRLAITLHESAGFKATQLIPLYKQERDRKTYLVPGDAGDTSPDGLYAQRIEFSREDFLLRREALMESPTYGIPRRQICNNSSPRIAV